MFQIKLTPELGNEFHSHLSENRENQAKQWHRRLGHASNEKMRIVLNSCEGINLQLKDLEELETVCEICQQAKHSRLKFGTTRSKAKRPLEIIHTDVCGPIDPVTWDKKRYFVSFHDDYTHYTLVYLIKNKSEVKDILKEYVKRVEACWNSKGCKIRCNNGKEYINEDILTWCKRRGIIIDNTTPYTPQLNGKAERLNRTPLDKVRVLLFDSSLDKEMWGEALYCSVYILNRLPTKELNCIPYEMWEKRKPNIKTMQVFGSIAYVKNMGPLKKLDIRSRKLIFVGYAPNGYRLWSKDERKIIINRDVRFEEIKEEKDNNKDSKAKIRTSKLKLNQQKEESSDEDEESYG